MSQLMYSPFGALNELHRELNRMFDTPYPRGEETSPADESAEWAPQVDIHEDENRFVVYTDLPGVDPHQVEVTLERNTLTIKGNRETVSEATRGGWKRRERASGTFLRQFTLPDTVDNEGITAKSTNGVLEITIPKGAKSKPVNITVES